MSHQGDVQQPSKQQQIPLIMPQQLIETPSQEKSNLIQNQVKNEEIIFEVKKEEQKSIKLDQQQENKQPKGENNPNQQPLQEIQKLGSSKHQILDVEANNLEEQQITKHPIIQLQNDKIIKQNNAQQSLAYDNGRQLLVEQSAANTSQAKLKQNVTNLEIENFVENEIKKEGESLNQLNQIGKKQQRLQDEQQIQKKQVKDIEEGRVDLNQQIEFWPHQKIQFNLKQDLNDIEERSEKQLENQVGKIQKHQGKQVLKMNTVEVINKNIEEKTIEQIKDKQEVINIIKQSNNDKELMEQDKFISSSNNRQEPSEQQKIKENKINEKEPLVFQSKKQGENSNEEKVKQQHKIIEQNHQEAKKSLQEITQNPKQAKEIFQERKFEDSHHEQAKQQVKKIEQHKDNVKFDSQQIKEREKHQKQLHQIVKPQGQIKQHNDQAELAISLPKENNNQIKKEVDQHSNHNKVVQIVLDRTQEPHKSIVQQQSGFKSHVQEGKNIDQNQVVPQCELEEKKIQKLQQNHYETNDVLQKSKEHHEVEKKSIQQQKGHYLQAKSAEEEQQLKEQNRELKQETKEPKQDHEYVSNKIQNHKQQSQQLQKQLQDPIKTVQELNQQVQQTKLNHKIEEIEVQNINIHNQQGIIKEYKENHSEVKKEPLQARQDHQAFENVLNTSNQQFSEVIKETEEPKQQSDEVKQVIQEVKLSHEEKQQIKEPNEDKKEVESKQIYHQEHQQNIVKEEEFKQHNFQTKREVSELNQHHQEVAKTMIPPIEPQQQQNNHEQIQRQSKQLSNRNVQQNLPKAEENPAPFQTINDNEVKPQSSIQPTPLREHSLASEHTQFPSGSHQILQFQQFTPSQTISNKPQQNAIQLPLISQKSSNQNITLIEEKKEQRVETQQKVKSVTIIQQQIKSSYMQSNMKSSNQAKKPEAIITPKRINQFPQSNTIKKEDNKQGVGKIARKNYGQKRVTDVIADIQKFNTFKKPESGKKVSIRKKTIESSKQNNIVLKSKVLSLTIGQLLSKNQTQQAEQLLGQIDDLKKKLFYLQKKRESAQIFDESPERRQQHKNTIMSNSSQKKLYTGKIYKRSQSNNAHVAQEIQTSGYIQHFHNSPYTSSAPRRRMSSTQQISGIRSAHKQTQQQNKTGPVIFRVKKNNKSLHGTLDFNSSQKINDYRSRQPQSEDKGFQTRHQPFDKLQFTEQERLVTIEKPKPRRFTFQQQFQEYVNRFFIDLGQELPRRDSSQQQLIQIAKNTFRIFGIDIHSQKNTTMSVKKYKNCVSFILDSDRTILWYYQGKFYFGGWKINNSGEGQKNGWGYDYSHSKYVFSGQFKENKRDGYGIMKFLTKQQDLIYEGEWKNGFKEGFGKQKQSDGSEYIGNWLQGKRDGKGKTKISQQCYYEGSFSMGVKNGFGKEKFKNGDSFEGHYLNGKFEGTGIYQWINGSKYEGQFKEGSRNGNGVWVSSITDKQHDRYEGQYKDDKKHGYGIYRWKDGTIYEGQFVNDLRHGEGVVTYGEGKSAKLQWFQGSMVTQKDKSRPRRRSITKNSHQQLQTEKPKIKFNPGRQGQTRSRPTRISHGLEEI